MNDETKLVYTIIILAFAVVFSLCWCRETFENIEHFSELNQSDPSIHLDPEDASTKNMVNYMDKWYVNLEKWFWGNVGQDSGKGTCGCANLDVFYKPGYEEKKKDVKEKFTMDVTYGLSTLGETFIPECNGVQSCPQGAQMVENMGCQKVCNSCSYQE